MIEKINQEAAHLKSQIVNHKVYAQISDLPALRIFMEHHIYAVWDFMSLLKALQINLTCTTLPWFPVGNSKTRQLINEIVAGEESDLDADGGIKSHFELYLDAMEQVGANTKPISTFIDTLQKGATFQEAYAKAQVPSAAQKFMDSTFAVINAGKNHATAAAFTFGREDLIPNMFHTMVNDLNSKHPAQVTIFKYYLDRHIEVDGDHHSHLALTMTSELCGTEDKAWNEASDVVKEALQQRINLWDAALLEIERLSETTVSLQA
ncbi:DUF3050 domain-containing protein [Pedobacter xixiisoli]|uniref:DUF3050 domain-containing protein n=1 Tax=Pedobacter xixiisoli TaxID=1476464 RepID=A0A286AF08_9SPHI|nr:DUF3050 domain-containing protein [Pedobacter xixiisoli]SOD20480.1 Protein of unknown function [Pedobacter xixiisoli]